MITGKHTSFVLDKRIGDIGEKLILPKLQDFFKDNTIKSTESKYGKFCKWDYESADGSIYELKTRRVRKTQYPTTLLPIHKVIDGKEQFFIFNYSDKQSYIKYDADIFKTFRVEPLIDGRYDFYKPTIDHYHIPVNLLQDM